MEELIGRIVGATGLDAATAQKAVGIILGFLGRNAPAGPVGDLLGAIPGAQGAVAQHGGEDAGGGLMGLAGQLGAAGLDMTQMQGVGREIFHYARDRIGEERLGEIAGAVPGLAGMI